jgi:peptidyl-prolyl cis-trans isomerase D
MLDLMRKHARNWIMKVLLGIIIVVFVFYFGSISGKQQAETVAVVDGKAVAYVDWAREYQNLIAYYRQRFGPTLNDEVLKQLNLKQVALDNLMQQAIVMQKAKDMRLTVSDEEVRMSILAMPAFQREGVFDEKSYQQALRFNKITPEDFERSQKNSLTMSLFFGLIQEGVKVSDREVYDLYSFQNEKVNLRFVQFAPDAYRTKVTPQEQDLEAYLKENSQTFRIPDSIQVKYLHFKGVDFAAGLTVTDAQIAEYYERHADSYKTGGGKRAALSDVKAKIAAEVRLAGGMHAAAAAAKNAHDVIYQQEDFEGYATKNGLAVTTSGFFSADAPGAALSRIGDAVSSLFKLDKGEISRVLSDSEGYYLFKVTAMKPAYTPSLKEVRAQVEKKFRDREAERLAKSEAESVLAALKQGKNLNAIASEKKLNLTETGLFLMGAEAPKLGASRELNAAVFQLTEKKPAPESVFHMGGKYVVLELKERTSPDDRNFEAQKESLRAALLQARRNNAVQSWINETKAAMIKEGKLKINKDIKDL